MIFKSTPNDTPMDELRDVLLDEPAEHVIRETLARVLARGVSPAVVLAELPQIGERRVREALQAAS